MMDCLGNFFKDRVIRNKKAEDIWLKQVKGNNKEPGGK